MNKSCDDCKWLVRQDTGYSNVTVEGCDADCIWGVNPHLPHDWWYGEDKKIIVTDCEWFKAGDQACFDVDGDVRVADIEDMELRAALMLYCSTERCIITKWNR